MARKFLYFIAVCIVLAIAGLIALRLWSDKLTRIAFVPDSSFVEQQPLEANAYHDPAMWFSRPGLGVTNDPARWQPEFAEASGQAAEPQEAEEAPRFAVFFVHPTSFLDRSNWNAPLDDADSQARARLFLRGLASPFNQASEIWAPRYRQATFGAYLTDSPAALLAIDAAYRDVSQAFDFFVETVGPDMPIVLAGHSQGASHIVRLLKDRIAGTPLQDRVAMAYPVGWPISVEHDLPALGLPACATADQAGCIVSWSSFAEPADPGMLLEHYRGSPGYDGKPRGESGVLCVNPLTGSINGAAPAERNLGTLVPNGDLSSGELVVGAVSARCDERGLLLIGDPPDLGAYVLPGNNYHVYDIPLFWRNLQLDVARRVRAWTTQPR
ncbi:DUF3089 domain-containing protein [Altererythrobacter soli]|uniref:DUF3089 domain-containing protein n=1 Tax=Croceibacterium soli TaxID=1739690 RepID=A0A6I4US50_9SPHN|nr:DUF3089 domain-containing protein [Croceibacterium soli]MXP41458.1 DUF3089 domain-containing protein [Croceibacterium soli]